MPTGAQIAADFERVRTAPDGEIVHVRAEPAALNPLALIQAAIERGMNPDQLGKLLDMQERWEKSQAAKQFAAAITAFQAECPPVQKRRASAGTGSFAYKFASYDDVMEAAAPVLARHGVVVTFVTDYVPGESGTDKAPPRPPMLKIVCRVRVGTHVEETPFTVPTPADMKVNDTQKFGAALSYGKRYAVCAALNIVVAHEDADADKLFENVTDRELKELRELAAERNINVAAFMKVLKVASDDLADIPRERFAHAVSLMKQKPIAPKPQPEAAK